MSTFLLGAAGAGAARGLSAQPAAKALRRQRQIWVRRCKGGLLDFACRLVSSRPLLYGFLEEKNLHVADQYCIAIEGVIFI
jgi:hypothetical protein